MNKGVEQMATREEDINWDCYIDPPYCEPNDEDIFRMEQEINKEFTELEEEEIKALLKKEPKKYRGRP